MNLYLLSGTSTEHSPGAAFPVRLYRVDVEKKLRPVRDVIPRTDGLRVAYAWGGRIGIIHPAIVSTTISIVHEDKPMLADDVVFNPRGLFPDDTAIAVAEPRGYPVHFLIPLLEDASDPRRLRGVLAVISADPSQSGPRVRLNEWEEYATLRCEGAPGGPAIFPALVGQNVDGRLAISVYGHLVMLDELPSELRRRNEAAALGIIAASQDYLVVPKPRTREEMGSPNPPDFVEGFVHVRSTGAWKRIRIDGNSSSSRLFGVWLASDVAKWNPEHTESPGRENERDTGSGLLPSVRSGYQNFRGRWNWSPGVLTLQNLVDERKIRIETGQEDSEILRADGDVVLYRVNDTIYQARIEGDQLKDTSVVVKDEDVPEIHWAFWSK